MVLRLVGARRVQVRLPEPVQPRPRVEQAVVEGFFAVIAIGDRAPSAHPFGSADLFTVYRSRCQPVIARWAHT